MSTPPLGSNSPSVSELITPAGLTVSMISALTALGAQPPSNTRSLLFFLLTALSIPYGLICWARFQSYKWVAAMMILLGGLCFYHGVQPLPPIVRAEKPVETPTPVLPATPTPPVDASDQFRAGLALFQKGAYEQAAAKFKEAARGARDPFDAYKYMGLCYMKLRAYEPAKEPLRLAYAIRAAEISPLLTDLHYNSALESLNNNNKEEAIRQHSFVRKYDKARAAELLRLIENKR